MFVRANFVDIYLKGMRDRSMRSGTDFAREIQLTDWSTAGNLSNRSSGVQIPRDICTRLKRYLYSAKCSWIIKIDTIVHRRVHSWLRHRLFVMFLAKVRTPRIFTHLPSICYWLNWPTRTALLGWWRVWKWHKSPQAIILHLAPALFRSYHPYPFVFMISTRLTPRGNTGFQQACAM